MSRRYPAAAVNRLPAATAGLHRAVRWVAAICIVACSVGCVLTQDIPDPALDIPGGYKLARSTGPDAPPTLDWWRGFGSPELTDLMEEAQKVNLDIAAAVARFRQADAQARVAGAALLPQLSASGPGNVLQESYSRISGSSDNGLSTGGREVVNFNTGLSASYMLDFWGQYRDAAQAAEETSVANRFDRDVTALTTLTAVATAYFQVLASQDRIRTAERNIASATRILEAITAAVQGRHRNRPRRRAAGKRAGEPARRRAAVAADAATRTSMRWRCWSRGRRKACR